MITREEFLRVHRRYARHDQWFGTTGVRAIACAWVEWHRGHMTRREMDRQARRAYGRLQAAIDAYSAALEEAPAEWLLGLASRGSS